MSVLPFSSDDLRGSDAIPVSGLGAEDNAALQRFRFAFTESGDKRIQLIRLLKDSGQVRAAFRDEGSGNRVEVGGCFVQVPGTPGTVPFDFENGQAARVQIPGMSSDTRFALSGFEFDRGSDVANVASITILPDERNGTVLVGFKDRNAGESTTGRLQYVLVPVGEVNEQFLHEGNNFYADETDPERSRPIGGRAAGAPGQRVISGFSFVYLYRTDSAARGDAKLKILGVNLEDHTFDFQDNDRHEIIQWKVDYLVV
ncbi:hypothetical protein [Rubrivirga sp.]|uniref:hypothetical protein n=1 Tax=Rubrivirga sp. TaxID=1885344 RepID=UPI003C74466D